MKYLILNVYSTRTTIANLFSTIQTFIYCKKHLQQPSQQTTTIVTRTFNRTQETILDDSAHNLALMENIECNIIFGTI